MINQPSRQEPEKKQPDFLIQKDGSIRMNNPLDIAAHQTQDILDQIARDSDARSQEYMGYNTPPEKINEKEGMDAMRFASYVKGLKRGIPDRRGKLEGKAAELASTRSAETLSYLAFLAENNNPEYTSEAEKDPTLPEHLRATEDKYLDRKSKFLKLSAVAFPNVQFPSKNPTKVLYDFCNDKESFEWFPYYHGAKSLQDLMRLHQTQPKPLLEDVRQLIHSITGSIVGFYYDVYEKEQEMESDTSRNWTEKNEERDEIQQKRDRLAKVSRHLYLLNLLAENLEQKVYGQAGKPSDQADIDKIRKSL